MKLLYAEDEIAMSEAVTNILRYHKYTVDAVYDGREALEYGLCGEYDGIILDVMMPELDGIEVLKRLRETGNKVPVLLLTAKSEIDDRIAGLDSGADDYLTKPFAMGELLARVRAMLRRGESFTPDSVSFGSLKLDRRSYELSGPDNSFVLSNIEFKIMELLILNRKAFISAEELLTKVWGYDTDTEINTVWVYISYLRRKISALGANVEISAKRNVGYMLEVVK